MRLHSISCFHLKTKTMKKLTALCFVILFIQKATSQPWQPLGSNEQNTAVIAFTAASTLFSCITADGTPYVSYIDDVPGGVNLGDFKMHVKKYFNGQWVLAGGAVSGAFPGSDYFPLAADGNTVYAAYSEPFNVAQPDRLSVKKLNTTGEWELVGAAGFSEDAASGTTIAVKNNKVYVAYSDGNANGKVTVKYFDNANPGDGWKTAGSAGFSTGAVTNTNIIIDDNTAYVTYRDFNDNTVVVKKFSGGDWQNAGTNSPSGNKLAIIPTLQVNDNHKLYLAYVDSLGNAVLKTLDNANQWVLVSMQPAEGITSNLSLLVLKNTPFIAYARPATTGAVAQVNVRKYDAVNNTWIAVGDQPVTASAASNEVVDLMSNGSNNLVISYHDFNSGIYAKTFDAGGLLPVTLTSFTAAKQGSANLLQWGTANEQRNKLFEVQHSKNGIVFTKIGEVPAAKGANDETKQYSFMHSTPAGGINYYRLKQVDWDGRFNYSKTISVINVQSPALIFPNPLKSAVHLANMPAGPKEIVIVDAGGKIYKHIKTNSVTVDIPVTMANGAYFVKLFTANGCELLKFIKE